MVTNPTRTVTVDRISNNGNPIARETHGGKTIHVPSGLEGESYEVRLHDSGSYVEARLVHREDGLRTREPLEGTGPTPRSDSLHDIALQLIGDDPVTMEQRECSDNRLAPREYPGKSHRSEIASRHD